MQTETNELSNLSLAELVTEFPPVGRVFLEHHLDFCCGGHRSLQEACQQAGVDCGAVLDEIQAELKLVEKRDAGWKDKPLTQLVDYIQSHYHARLRADLQELGELARKVESVHGERADCPRGLVEHLANWRAALEDHMAKEEQVFFTLVRQGHGAHCGMPVRILTQEHDDHARAMRRTRELTVNLTPPADACRSWSTLYAQLVRVESEMMEHVHLENNVLFPRALAQ